MSHSMNKFRFALTVICLLACRNLGGESRAIPAKDPAMWSAVVKAAAENWVFTWRAADEVLSGSPLTDIEEIAPRYRAT